ncbi:hypothetical protein [Methanobacterium petrolearium]|uniref:hypothetical protein n=1 Tax=Methanobacterium petrolearium TaxID=710190 RepID=UPI001AE6F972|nr:hypothetical protein [Methanobacterium petrolearium]MBP1946405.1 hypothetical protein [Methanobacterium petrolearium]BDZ70569.1 hypothetical protein GCM10025861_10860 [Methanobacterium petrolearium]
MNKPKITPNALDAFKVLWNDDDIYVRHGAEEAIKKDKKGTKLNQYFYERFNALVTIVCY